MIKHCLNLKNQYYISIDGVGFGDLYFFNSFIVFYLKKWLFWIYMIYQCNYSLYCFFSVISIFLSNSIIFAVNFYVLAFHYSPFFVVAHFSQFFDIYFAHYSLFYKPALHPLNLTCIISAFNNHKWNALNSSDVSFLLCVNKTFFVSSGIWIKLYKCQRLSLDNLNNLYANIYIFFGFHFFSKLTSSY